MTGVVPAVSSIVRGKPAAEQKLTDLQTAMMILCNPHNLAGIIWDKDTLARIGELYWKYHVTVVSDHLSAVA